MIQRQKEINKDTCIKKFSNLISNEKKKKSVQLDYQEMLTKIILSYYYTT